jgi:hypothetical protein
MALAAVPAGALPSLPPRGRFRGTSCVAAFAGETVVTSAGRLSRPASRVGEDHDEVRGAALVERDADDVVPHLAVEIPDGDIAETRGRRQGDRPREAMAVLDEEEVHPALACLLQTAGLWLCWPATGSGQEGDEFVQGGVKHLIADERGEPRDAIEQRRPG